MYLISVYFDDKTNRIISRYISRIAEKTGNAFMTENHVPPHMTISSIEARTGALLIPHMKKLEGIVSQGTVQFVSVGMFFPYVMYLTPVLNEYLQNLAQNVYKAVSDIPEIKINKFYQPMQWLPHITLGKKLSSKEMRIAFEIMQNEFTPFEGKVVSMGLAKTNPHEDILIIEL